MTGVPQYYSDTFYLVTNPWEANIIFTLSPPKEGIAGHNVCVMRLSHETAKALAMMLRQQLKRYERNTGTNIALPTGVMSDLGLASEDW